MKDQNVVVTMLLEEKKDKIASAIQTARVQKGWTQEELGEHVSMSRNTIARIENKRFFPSMESFLLILDCLDLTLKIGNEEI
jgi:transcriptional regulator with XRE-family HTH domain